jgi:hypothetical protein
MILGRRRPAYVARLVLRPGQRLEQTVGLGQVATVSKRRPRQ